MIRIRAVTLATAVLAWASVSSASVIYDATLVINGAGLGTVITTLTMHDTGQPAPTETGCVAWDGSAVITGTGACDPFGSYASGFGGDTTSGASQNNAPTFADIDVPAPEALVVVFNPNEPSADSIKLDTLVFKAFRADGTQYFTAALLNPVLFASTNPGIGNAGFSFVLDPSSIAAWNLLGMLPTDRFGLDAGASLHAGGSETFFAIRNPNYVPPPPVSEPMSLTLLGVGLIGFSAHRRWRKRA